MSRVLSPNDERSLEHKIPAVESALSASTDVAAARTVSRRLAAGNDHDHGYSGAKT